MIEKIKELYAKHKEIIVYVIFGVLTTAVDFATYILLTRLFSMNEDASNVIAQIVAIIFAFFTNKLYVFNDKSMKMRDVLSQFAKFASVRLVTLVLNSGLFFVMNKMGINDIITKAVVSVIVIILNYIFSKLIVFRKKADK